MNLIFKNTRIEFCKRFLLLFFLWNKLFAQTYYGGCLGLNISTFYTDKYFPLVDQNYNSFQLNSKANHTKPRCLWTGGYRCKIVIKDKFSFQPELIYTAKGRNINQVYDITKNDLRIVNQYTDKLILHYIDLPLMCGYKVKEHFNILAGIQISRLLRAKFDSEQTFKFYNSSGEMITSETFSQVKSNEKNNFKKTDFAGVVGVDYVFPKGLTLGFRSLFGLKRVYTENIKSKNLGFQFTIGYLIEA